MSPICERCERVSDPLIPHEIVDSETGEKRIMYLCWDCDFDIINGRGDCEDEAWEVQNQHDEEDYEYDPLYYSPPRWMKEGIQK